MIHEKLHVNWSLDLDFSVDCIYMSGTKLSKPINLFELAQLVNLAQSVKT